MDIDFICSDSEQIYYARGHVDKLKMQESVNAEEGSAAQGFGAPEHTYMRARPNPAGGTWYDTNQKPGRGAFPVTTMLKVW